jgi:hypothetical protein
MKTFVSSHHSVPHYPQQPQYCFLLLLPIQAHFLLPLYFPVFAFSLANAESNAQSPGSYQQLTVKSSAGEHLGYRIGHL